MAVRFGNRFSKRFVAHVSLACFAVDELLSKLALTSSVSVTASSPLAGWWPLASWLLPCAA